MKKQKKYFITRRYFTKISSALTPNPKDQRSQWWLYELNPLNGFYEPVVGTDEPNYKKAKEILLK